MSASNTRFLRWPTRIVVGTVAIFVLVQVLLRTLRRAAPGLMPSRLAPLLTYALALSNRQIHVMDLEALERRAAEAG
jgi:hypothetical protein